MGLIARDTGGGEFEIAPEGTHIAVCDMVIDLGLQETTWGMKHKVYIRWELVHERTKDDQPMVVGTTYTLSLSQNATLRQHLESWRGRVFTEQELAGFDLFNILGKPCQVTVLHNQKNGKTYANVTGVTAIPKGVDKPQPENTPIAYSIEDHNEAVFENLPDWLKKKINLTGAQNEDNYEPAREYGSDTPF